MKNRVIIHFQPLEYYPPVQNLIKTQAGELSAGKKVFVFTTRANDFMGQSFVSGSSDVIIIRLGKTGNGLGALSRYMNYVYFFVGCFMGILYRRPSTILYYETISAYPAYLYKRYIRSRVSLMIHYHEYTSPEEYRTGMRLVRYFHQCEKWLYTRSSWLSHTNGLRMARFLNDISPIQVSDTHIVPNYPSVNWRHAPKSFVDIPVKCVYAGAISTDNMYSKEFAAWVIAQKGNVTWDIFSLNMTGEAKNYFESLGSEWIRICGGVNYDTLPDVLKKYDVGVILYKGHIQNYIINAPNKLFEYHICGLDVWFPDIMKGSLPYISNMTYPKIVAINFSRLEDANLLHLINRNGYRLQQGNFYCEDALISLNKHFLKNA